MLPQNSSTYKIFAHVESHQGGSIVICKVAGAPQMPDTFADFTIKV